MELVPPAERSMASYYMPHHAVFRRENPQKIRVVFNASQKTSDGISLNEFLLPGPKLQADISIIITHWRTFKYVFVTDIVKMFRQILVNKEDTNWQRIVWRPTIAGPIQDYRALTVTYGTASAPYLSLRVLQQLAIDGQESHPEAADILHRQVYVDDIFGGADDVELALQRRDQLVGLLASAGMTLGKWAANELLLLRNLKAVSTSEITVKIEEAVSTLGLKWHPRSDYFYFKIDLNSSSKIPTKREILSDISKLFDPLGWLAPTLVTAKIILQDIWISGSDWDEPLSNELTEIWANFRGSLTDLESLRIPRWLGRAENDAWHLHGFADASKRAYAAAIYAVTPQVTSTLLMAKSKIAPIKVQTLPRLELCGAHLLVRLTKQIVTQLKYPPESIFFWTDSRVVLDWLGSHPSKWQTFVANRVSEITTSFPQAEWRHVRSAQNPADCATRGITPLQLAAHELWWRGPPWLIQPKSEWPTLESTASEGESAMHSLIDQEETIVTCASMSEAETTVLSNLEKLSTFSRALRVLAYCGRWLHNVKSKGEDRHFGVLSAGEYNWARTACFRAIQDNYFKHDKSCLLQRKPLTSKGSLQRLAPFICESGLIRVGGRLGNSKLPFSERHPIILPGKCLLIRRLIEEVHRLTLHGGTQLMLSHLSRSVWILKGRRIVSGVFRRCVRCLRFSQLGTQQQMAPLPPQRIEPRRPFSISGIDYAGPVPILFSKGRGAKTTKGYIAIFICLVVRAVHIEIVSDLSTEAFLAAYARFTSRRGCCSTVYSDNATNFQGAAKELANLFAQSSDFFKAVTSQLALQGTSWKFIPPRAPHFGGLWEAAVRSFKYHLSRALGEAILTFEELSTLAAKIESCLNSRPLCPLSGEALDEVALTPGHFLVGSALLSHPEPYEEPTENIRLTNRWKLVANIRNSFWARWRKEVLQHLQQRNKWLHSSPNLQIGDVVIIKDELSPPARWPLARVIKTHPGSDGLVRVVTLRTAKSEFIRPVVKLIKLPTEATVEEYLKRSPQESITCKNLKKIITV